MPQLEWIQYYGGPATYFRAPERAPEELPEGSVGVLGVPLDGWTYGRNGQRMGPRALREASLGPASYYAVQTNTQPGYVDVTTGNVWTVPAEPRIFDCGDVRIYHQDWERQTQAIADKVQAITERGAMPLVLGGDHYVPYPSFLGFVEGLRQRKPDVRVGFLCIDGHFDFWDELKDLGRYNHGTFARRISEHEAVGNMVWWGLNGTHVIEPEPLELMVERGFVGYTVRSIRERGVEQTMREALEKASDGADVVYVTFDVDVTDGAFAPGTNSIVVNGLNSGEVLEGVSVIPEFDSVQAFDVCELLPQYDVGGDRTARYANHVILTVISDRILDSTPQFGDETLKAVFP